MNIFFRTVACVCAGWLVIGGGVAAASNAVSSAVTPPVYSVTATPRIGSSVRLREWHETIAMPEAQTEVVSAVREAMTAERIARLTSGFDVRRIDDAPILQWVAHEAAMADAISRRSERDGQDGGGALDSWISDFVTRQTEYGDQSVWDNAFSGRADADSGRERSWGWLADDILANQRSRRRQGDSGFGSSYDDSFESFDSFGGRDGSRSSWDSGGADSLSMPESGRGPGVAFPIWR